MNTIRDENVLICKQMGWDNVPVQKVWLLFTEEIGELAAAIRQSQGLYRKPGKRQDVLNEMGDVFSYLFQLSHILGVDLDKMWLQQKHKMTTKMYV